MYLNIMQSIICDVLIIISHVACYQQSVSGLSY